MWAYTNETGDYVAGGKAAGLLSPRVGRGLRRLNPLLSLGRWMQRGLTTTELHGLDDRSLADLGITRGDFPAILSGTFRRGE